MAVFYGFFVVLSLAVSFSPANMCPQFLSYIPSEFGDLDVWRIECLLRILLPTAIRAWTFYCHNTLYANYDGISIEQISCSLAGPAAFPDPDNLNFDYLLELVDTNPAFRAIVTDSYMKARFIDNTSVEKYSRVRHIVFEGIADRPAVFTDRLITIYRYETGMRLLKHFGSLVKVVEFETTPYSVDQVTEIYNTVRKYCRLNYLEVRGTKSEQITGPTPMVLEWSWSVMGWPTSRYANWENVMISRDCSGKGVFIW